VNTTAPDGGTPEPGRSAPRRRLPPEAWESWDDEQLMQLRLCDLDLRIEGSPVEPRVQELYAEMEAHGLSFRPHVWLSDEWFTPDNVPGIAIPFYLAHPRLARLEHNQMLEVEGGDPEWCLRILRHEAGHAIEHAYALHRRGRRRRLFGSSAVPYPDSYQPRPYSRRYVIHLDAWYAQSHPDEDFAETFAAWLTPGSDWRERYKGWPALRKLEYVDALMRELAGKPQVLSTQRQVEPLSRLRKTLRTHYRRKRERFGVGDEAYYDRDLRRLFPPSEDPASRPAAVFLSRIRKDVRRQVRRWTGVYLYSIDLVLGDMIERCRALGLRLTVAEEQARQEFTILLTVETLRALSDGRLRRAL
jgi:hypothetical protein